MMMQTGPSGRIVYDGKRMRKAITRRTVDHCTGIMRFLEDQAMARGNKTRRVYADLQPTPSHIINVRCPRPFALTNDDSLR